MNPKVSIIIPTYNRAHLVGETLDSILGQTYQDWECIIVDDGSSDNTESMVTDYVSEDARFQFIKRPGSRPKGANSCRNYGLELSKGSYVNWFDSDDLMVPEFLESKMRFMTNNNCDFLYSKTVNFDGMNSDIPMFDVPVIDLEVNSANFIKQVVTWSTPDFMCTRASIGDVRFNEGLKSGQEFNFFSNYLLNNVKGMHLDEVLTKRRVHEESIQSVQHNEKSVYLRNKYAVYFQTYLDIKDRAGSDSLNYLLNLAMSKSFELALQKKRTPSFMKLISQVAVQKGFWNATIFLVSIFVAFVFGSGHVLMNQSRKI